MFVLFPDFLAFVITLFYNCLWGFIYLRELSRKNSPSTTAPFLLFFFSILLVKCGLLVGETLFLGSHITGCVSGVLSLFGLYQSLENPKKLNYGLLVLLGGLYLLFGLHLLTALDETIFIGAAGLTVLAHLGEPLVTWLLQPRGERKTPRMAPLIAGVPYCALSSWFCTVLDWPILVACYLFGLVLLLTQLTIFIYSAHYKEQEDQKLLSVVISVSP